MATKSIFIIGVGRSGTSLLQSMLHAHPDIEFVPETGFLRRYVFNKSNLQLDDPARSTAFKEALDKDDKFSRIKLDTGSFIEGVKDVHGAYYKMLASVKKPNTLYLGDKDPRFLDFIPNLSAIAPKGKVIHIIRDPREVVLSRTKADWSKHWPFFMHAAMYNAQLERGRMLGKKYFGSDYMELYYEDLVKQPEQVLQKISAFLNIAYSDAMLHFGESAKKLVDEKEMQWKKETLGPLLTSNTNKWEKALTNDQIYIIQEICSGTFKKHPYAKKKVKVSVTTKMKALFYKCFSEVFKIVYPVRVKFIK